MPGSNNTRLEIKDAFAVYPDDWWVLDYENPSDCSYVGVVETKYGEDLGISHILFVSGKPIRSLSFSDTDHIYDCCAKQFPAFAAMLENVVKEELDENGKIINAQEYLNSPRPGIFDIPDYNGASADFSLGSVVVRRNTEKRIRTRR